MSKQEQAAQINAGNGFIAALDQSGGSTPTALQAYGIPHDAYSNEDEMFDLMHRMRSRIVNAPSFSGEKVIGAILFEMTMERDINGKPAPLFLWEDRHVVPFLKIDKGLMKEADGVQLMKPMDHLERVLPHAAELGVFGTKMRSVINLASPTGITEIVSQQFEVGKQVISQGLVPVLEPEINIQMAEKAKAEELLRDALLLQLNQLAPNEIVMLKLSLPEQPNIYQPLVDHPNVLRVVALSGGYSRDQANARLAQNSGIVASFSRALTEGLSADQSEDAFNQTLDTTIEEVFAASVAG